MYEERIQNALETVFSEISDDFPTAMPLLDDYRQTHGKKTTRLPMSMCC
jgi:hypothetical protein